MTRLEYEQRRHDAIARHTGDQYGYYGEMMDVDYDYIVSLEARIAELEAENARLEKLNSAALEKLSYLACPPNRNNYGLPCNDSDDCVACWCEYLSGCG